MPNAASGCFGTKESSRRHMGASVITRLQLDIRFTLARAKLVVAQRRDEASGIKDGFGFEHEIDGAGQFDGQDGVGFEFIAQACFEALGEGPEAGIPFGNDGGFAEGPAEIGIAEFGAAEALDFAGAGDGAFDEAAITEKVLHGGEALDVADFMEDGQAEELANAGDGLQEGEIAAVGLFGQAQELFFEDGQLRIVMVNEGQVVLEGELADGMGFAGEEAFLPGFPVVKGLAEGGTVVSQLMGLDAGEELGAFRNVEDTLAEQSAQGPLGGGINVTGGNEVGAQEVGDFFGVNAIVLVFAAVNGLEIKGMGQDEVDVGGLAGIREPIPAEHALGADGQIVAVRGDEFKKVGEVVVANVGVEEFFAGAVHDADVHLAGMEINSAVEFSGGDVILHSDHSLRGRETPG